MSENVSMLPSMKLKELLNGFAEIQKSNNLTVLGLAVDSREVKPGYLFFAYKGTSLHGVNYIDSAITAGAIAIAIDDGIDQNQKENIQKNVRIPIFYIEDLSNKLGYIAAKFYGEPSKKMSIIGVTGTNGKTSCTHFLAQCLNNSEHLCGVLGTLGAGIWGHMSQIQHTTPGAIELQNRLYEMQLQNAKYIAMEVSSHGLDQGRVNACQFDVAVFTNLTRDHLDYHGDIRSYGNSKLKLFTQPGLTKVVLNLDDPYSFTILENIPRSLKIIGITLDSTLKVDGVEIISASNISLKAKGLAFDIDSPWGSSTLQSCLVGEFNVSNLLTVLAVAIQLGFSFDEVLEKLKIVSAPPGRLETFGSEATPLVVVDYAHTPDALEKVLRTLQEYAKGKLLVLFGCGGDRDRGKRALMGELAEQFADVVWLTDDNPRTEKSQDIINDILKGIKNSQSVCIEHDRASAIKNIIAAATSNDDVVLIAGKGHEDYQIHGNTRYEFSDRKIVAQLVGEAA